MTQLQIRLALILVFAVSLVGCSSRQHKTVSGQSAGENRNVENTQAVLPVKPPPTAGDVRNLVVRTFAGTVSTEGQEAPKFTVGDFNGDGSEDIAVLVRPNPGKLGEINNPQADWIIWNPAKVPLPKPHQRVLKMPSDLKPEYVIRSDRLLAVIHGQGPAGWRNPQAYQAFLLRSLSGKNLLAKRLENRLPFQAKPEDVLPENVGGVPGYVYWLGTVYVWQPESYLTQQRGASTSAKAAARFQAPKP
jgi:hypothetical protein